MEQMHTVGTVARRCRVSEGTVRNWAKDGKLPVFRTPSGLRLFRESDVEQFARERETTR